MNVAVRELKARLSEYLERVARGESIVVTNRGHPIARIVPAPRFGAMEEGLAEGWITRRREAPPTAFVPEKPAADTSVTSTDVLRADRDS